MLLWTRKLLKRGQHYAESGDPHPDAEEKQGGWWWQRPGGETRRLIAQTLALECYGVPWSFDIELFWFLFFVHLGTSCAGGQAQSSFMYSFPLALVG